MSRHKRVRLTSNNSMFHRAVITHLNSEATTSPTEPSPLCTLFVTLDISPIPL